MYLLIPFYTIVYTKVLNIVYTNLYTIRMVTEAETTIQQAGSRHTIYLRKDLVNDSAFPFEPKQPLIVKIEGERLVIEKLSRQKEDKENEES